ncbi:MAG: FKBP-type peptidyl-prolyl cis-trans isomerase [Planctomycetota bacterium]
MRRCCPEPIPATAQGITALGVALLGVSAFLVGCGTSSLPRTRAADPLTDTGGGYPPVELDSGVRYRDVTLGEGQPATEDALLLVRYEGRLDDGRVFDATGEDARLLPLGKLIEGWRTGVSGMRPGGVRTVVIPPNSAYGDGGDAAQAIPPRATLTYVVQLLSVYPGESESDDAPGGTLERRTAGVDGPSSSAGDRVSNRFLPVTPPPPVLREAR